MSKTAKLEKLLKFHRLNVWNADNGDLHERALQRLKKTQAFKTMCDERKEAASIRTGERLARMGY